MVAHACNPSTWEVETRGFQVEGQPQQLSKTLFQNKKDWGYISEIECPGFNPQHPPKKRLL